MMPYDIVMIVILAGATLFGFWKGMAWQIASLASLVLSYFVAIRFSESLAPHLSQAAPFNRFLAMLVLYCGTSLVIWVGFRVVHRGIDRVKLNEFDRQIGGLFGLAKGVLFCLAVTFFAVTLSSRTRDEVLKSKSGTYVATFLHRADSVMPPELHAVLDPYIQQLEEGLDPEVPNERTELDDQWSEIERMKEIKDRFGSTPSPFRQ